MSSKEIDFSCPDPKLEKFWNLFIEDISSRDNVKIGHLKYLEILCRLMVMEEKLYLFIEENGYSYPSENPRSGEMYKEYIEVRKHKECLMEIRQYTVLLGLKLEQDKKITKNKEMGDWE